MEKKVRLLVVVSLIMLLLVVSACSGGDTAPAEPPAEEEAAAEQPAAEEPAAQEETMEEGATAEEEAMEEEEAMPASDEPIKMGFLAPTSSVAAQSAQDMIDGFNLFWEQHGKEVAGRPVEIFIDDSVGDPDVALSKARLMVEQREVDMLFGTLFANEGLAVAEYVKETGTPTFFQIPSADDLTQRTRIPNVIRPAGWTSSGPHHPFGEWVAENTDCKNVYTIGSDYAFGHEVVGGFVNTFTDSGGSVVEQVWNPIAEADFSSYLAAIQEAQPDCVFVLEVGASAVRFTQAYHDFGLAGEIPIYYGEVPADVSILRGLDPPEIGEGIISVGHYAEGRDAPATQDFVNTYDERYGNIPSYYAVASYTVAQWITEAIESVNGDLSDTDAFLNAVRAVELEDSPMGPMKLDEYGNPIQNMYIRKTEIRDDGRLWNVVTEEIPNVSQFFYYDVDAFLAQPVYSRDYQGIDWPSPEDVTKWKAEWEAGTGVSEAPAEEEAMPASDEPIKMGFLAPTSSVAAQSAQDMIDGFNLYWEQHGQEVAGRPVEIFIDDSVGDPDVALSKARLMVEQREVDMLFGTLFANEGLAVAEYVKETGTPTFFQIPSADDLTQRTRIPNVIRPAGWTSSGPHHPFGEWVAQNTDCKNVYTIGSDYAFGHEVVGGFVNTFTDNGGSVVEQVWNPIAEADFSSYLAAILEAQPDCVFVLEVGASAVRFTQAYHDFGLAGEIPIYYGEVPADVSILRGLDPPEIGEGIISVGHYAEGRDAPATQDFVNTYDERYGNIPSYYAVASYTVAQWIVEAIESVGGDLSDTEAFLDAVRAVELEDSPMGPMKLDEYGNPIQNMYIRQTVIRDDGRLWNIVLEEIPNVSQFYKYDPDAFLAQPVYSRDYQGIDWP